MSIVEIVSETPLRLQLVASLRSGQAFESLETILDEVPVRLRFEQPQPSGKSPWQVIEHMRLSLEDLAAYIDNEHGTYKSKIWPDDFWPRSAGPVSESGWDESVAELFRARQRVEDLIMDPSRDLFAPFRWHHGHTLLRQALIAIEHTAYHCGELVEISAQVE